MKKMYNIKTNLCKQLVIKIGKGGEFRENQKMYFRVYRV